MTQQTLANARVINPILTAVARGYQQPGMWARSALFPTVTVGQRSGTIITFTPEDFKIYNTRRAPGAATMRVNFGRASGTYAIQDHSLEGTLPIEVMQEAMAVPGIDEGQRTIAAVQAIMELEMEKQAADLARTAGSYGSNTATLSGTSQWSHASSTPIAAVEAAREAIRAKTGRYPNTMILPPTVLTQLKQHASIIDRIKYTGRDIPTIELLQSLFEVPRIIVPDSIFLNDGDSVTTVPGFNDVWGKDVVLAYVNTQGVAQRGSPSYGYTYQLEGYPMAEEPYYERNEKSWFYPYTDARMPVLAGATAGWLWKDVVA